MIWIVLLLATVISAVVFPPLTFLFGIVIVFNVFREELSD